MRVLLGILIAVLALLAANALAYGGFYIVSPGQGLGEFGHDPAAAATGAAIHLVSLAGIAFLGYAGFAILAIVQLLKGKRGGLGISLVLGAVYLAIGAYTATIAWWVDTAIYGGFGAATCLLSATLWRIMPARS